VFIVETCTPGRVKGEALSFLNEESLSEEELTLF
jgi:hypothetical protein